MNYDVSILIGHNFMFLILRILDFENNIRKLQFNNGLLATQTLILSSRISTAVEQVVACAPVTQRARVRSPVGISSLGEVFSGFSSLVKTNVRKL